MSLVISMQQKAQQYQNPPPNYSLRQHSINGFTQKPSVAQIVSYIVIAMSISIYFSSTIVIQNYPILLGLYIFFGIILIITGAISSIKDPTDRIVYYYKWSRYDKKINFSPNFQKVLFCEYCDSYCYVNSKHCRTCNRCVNNFDHHCIWFNNCIGQRNYKYFFLSIIATFCYGITIIIHASMISFHVDFSNKQDLIRIILSWLIAFIMLIFVFLIMNLIILHIYLNYTNQTTYEFLQKKKKEEQKEQQLKKLKLNESLNKKNSQSITILESNISAGNTKSIKVQNQESKSKIIEHKHENIFSTTSNKIKNQNDYFEEQLSKHSIKDKSIKQQTDRHKQNDHDMTMHNHQQKNHSDDGQKLPYILAKNKSLKLLLSGSKATNPSKRKLQARDQQQSQG